MNAKYKYVQSQNQFLDNRLIEDLVRFLNESDGWRDDDVDETSGVKIKDSRWENKEDFIVAVLNADGHAREESIRAQVEACCRAAAEAGEECVTAHISREALESTLALMNVRKECGYCEPFLIKKTEYNYYPYRLFSESQVQSLYNTGVTICNYHEYEQCWGDDIMEGYIRMQLGYPDAEFLGIDRSKVRFEIEDINPARAIIKYVVTYYEKTMTFVEQLLPVVRVLLN